MSIVNPIEVLKQVAEAVPASCRQNIVIVGSLAATQAFFGDKQQMTVQTKDIDCLIRPNSLAAVKGEEIAQQLLEEKWTRRKVGDFTDPGNPDTPEDILPAMRLYPPGMGPDIPGSWFLELLTEPASSDQPERQYYRMVVGDEHYALPSFRYFSITAHNPITIDHLGISYARPSMMVLTNLLHHPRIKPERMSSKIEGRSIKRSNKDLGRVLAIGYLYENTGESDFRRWGTEWALVLQLKFKDEWKDLAKNAGNGLREILDSPEDLEEAHYTCRYGLLTDSNVTESDLKEVGERIYGDALEILIDIAPGKGPHS